MKFLFCCKIYKQAIALLSKYDIIGLIINFTNDGYGY